MNNVYWHRKKNSLNIYFFFSPSLFLIRCPLSLSSSTYRFVTVLGDTATADTATTSEENKICVGYAVSTIKSKRHTYSCLWLYNVHGWADTTLYYNLTYLLWLFNLH